MWKSGFSTNRALVAKNDAFCTTRHTREKKYLSKNDRNSKNSNYSNNSK